jgi:hypothetical protein
MLVEFVTFIVLNLEIKTSLMKTQDPLKSQSADLSGVDPNDLYKYISPPNPLVERNKYVDDLPRSYFSML